MGSQLPPVILSKLKTAERIRDKAIHGSRPTDAELRNAIKDVLDYSEDYDSHVKRLAGFCPFGDLRGILSGRAWRLDRPTTKLVLKGLGFKVS